MATIRLEDLLQDREVYRFLKNRYGDAIPSVQFTTSPRHISPDRTTTTVPPQGYSHALRSAPQSPTGTIIPITSPNFHNISPVPTIIPSRPSSSMDTSFPPSSASECDSHPPSDTEFTQVSGNKRRRKSTKTPIPNKITPKTSAPTPSAPLQKEHKVPAPPPLFIQDKAKWTAISGWCTEHKIQFTSARSTQQGVKVTVPTASDHRSLTRILKDRLISFHTYTLPEERLLRVVIRNVPKELETDDIKASLKAQNFPVHEVHRMVRGKAHEPYDMVLVSLDHTDAGKAIFNAKTVCSLSGITVEPPHKKQTPSQCHRCQLYGHSARNCFARPRCVKCLGNHATAECDRPKDRSLCSEPPSCVLCGGVGHPANYRGCPKAPRPSKRTPKPSLSTPPNAPIIIPTPQRSPTVNALKSQGAFPPLPTPQSTTRPSYPSIQPIPNLPSPRPRPPPPPISTSSQGIDSDLALIARFASIFDFADLRRMAEQVRDNADNPMALLQIAISRWAMFEALSNFKVNP